MTAILGLLDFVPRWLMAVAIAGLVATNCASHLRLEHARTKAAALQVEVADANTRAAEQARSLQQKVSEAHNAARTREIQLRAAAAAAGDAAASLQHDLDAARDQLAGLSRDAAAERAAAVQTVLGQCSRRYQELAARADRHASDLRTLIEAWPR